MGSSSYRSRFEWRSVACGLQVHLELARRLVVDLELARGGTVVLLLRELEVPFEDLWLGLEL